MITSDKKMNFINGCISKLLVIILPFLETIIFDNNISEARFEIQTLLLIDAAPCGS